MVSTKSEAREFISAMSDSDFANLCELLNTKFGKKSEQRLAAERKFVNEVKKAEDEVEKGNYVNSEQLRKYLGFI
jgi:hypothetical protein